MDVVFYNRDFTQRISGLQVKVERYSMNMIGGPDKAYLKAPADADKWELMKLLRCPVEIRGDDGGLKWWGYVNRVSLPYGEQRAGLALDELYNYVVVTDGSIADASDSQSIQEYGQKEYLLNVQNADSTQLAASRDLFLTQHQYARPEFEFSGGSDEVAIECYGWFQTLDWKYYSSTPSTSNIENTTQLSTIVASTGQFLSGTIVEDLANLTSNDDRDGTTTGLSNVIQILRAGTSNSRPLLAYVDKDRYLHVYERDVEPLPGTPDYLYGSDGKLYNASNQLVPDQDCKTAVWVQILDVPSQLGGFSSMRPFFVASAEYNVERDKTTYTPADTYEQIRLAKYISSAMSTNSGGGIGSSSTLPISWTPTPYNFTTIPDRLHRNGSVYNITSGSTAYMTFTSTPSQGINVTYNGLNLADPGATYSAEPAWQIYKAGIYTLYIHVFGTTNAITKGSYSVLVQRDATSIYSNSFAMPIPNGGSTGFFGTVLSMIYKTPSDDQYLRVRIGNATDATDMDVSYGDMILTLERYT